MRHQLTHRKLTRSMSHRKAMLRNMVTSMVLEEQLRTTLPKAKELKPLIEKYVTLGRNDSVHNRRLAASFIFDKGAVAKLFTVLGPRFKNRAGGYTRIIRTDFRKGDSAEMAVIEFIERTPIVVPEKKESTEESAKEASTKKASAEKKEAKPKAAKKAAGKEADAEAAPKAKKATKKTKKSE